MFKVKVITQGRCKEPWLQEALAEYEKRLKGKMTLEWILVDKPKDLIEKALNESQLIALDLQGKLLSSENFSKALFTKWGSRPSFVIGGAEGLSPEIVAHSTFQISLSPLTFTHQIVRLILVEQLYRAIEIEEGTSYHK